MFGGLQVLDASKSLASGPLDLVEDWASPDLVVGSLYKLFGYPTGIGVLLVRNTLQESLCSKRQRPFFGGGTIAAAAAEADYASVRSTETSF